MVLKPTYAAAETVRNAPNNIGETKGLIILSSTEYLPRMNESVRHLTLLGVMFATLQQRFGCEGVQER